MQTFLGTLLVFGIVMAAMSIGVVLSGRRLKGSCGGTGEDCDCELAKQRVCEKFRETEASS